MKHLIFILLLFFTLSCKDQSIYIELNGTKLTKDDLEKEMPEQFKTIYSEYQSKVKELLKELAHRKMIEKEAKEKGLSVDQYLDEIRNKSENPSETEINEFYKKVKESGQAGNLGEEDLKNRIFQYLKQEKIQQAFTQEISKLKQKYKYKEPLERVSVTIFKDDPVRGNPEGKVVIIEFSDFECPYCLRFQPTGKQILEKYGDKIKWIFKDFPLDFHKNAMTAHLAATCVYKLKPEKFWQFYDTIFNPNRTNEVFQIEFLKKLSTNLGIKAQDFENCVQDPKTKEKIEKNIQEGIKNGVTGTPAFFINGRKITGAQPIIVFEEIINEELSN